MMKFKIAVNVGQWFFCFCPILKKAIFFSPYNVFFFPSFYRKQIILGLLSEISDVENKLLSVHCVMQIYPPLPRKEKKAYLQANVRLLSKYVPWFFAKIEATFLSGKSGKVRHPNISHKIKNNFKMSSKSIFFTLFNFYCPGYGKNTFKIHGHDHEPENVYPVWQRMRCGTTSLTPFGTTYVPVSYNLDPAIIIPEQTGLRRFLLCKYTCLKTLHVIT